MPQPNDLSRSLVAFQQDNGMTADGEITEELVHALLKKK